MKRDIVATVHFYPTAAGGRRSPTPPDRFGCIMMIGGANLDVRLMLDGVGRVSPGQTVTVPISFLSADLARPLCSVGAPFRLGELGVVADGVIDQLLFE